MRGKSHEGRLPANPVSIVCGLCGCEAGAASLPWCEHLDSLVTTVVARVLARTLAPHVMADIEAGPKRGKKP